MFKNKTLFFLATLLLITILAACGDAENDSGNQEDDSEAPEEQAGGELNFAYNAQPPNLDPHSNTNLATRDIGYHVFETLLTLNDSLEVEPMLADTYDVSDDGKEITFHLREGVTFHDGE